MPQTGPQFDALALDIAHADSPEIVDWLRRKGTLEIDRWDAIGQAEYARAFTAAGTAGSDVVADLYAALLRVMEEGGTERDYADLVVPTLRAKGWLADNPGQLGHRVQLIYDTNLRVARGIGRWERVQRVAHVMPYLLGTTVGDRRVRDEHRAFQGVFLPVSHPFWTEFWPPLYFRCRCDVVQLTRGQAARRGLEIMGDAEAEARAAIIRPQSWGRNAALVQQDVLREQVLAANTRRVPGALPLDAQTLAGAGKARWNAIMGLALQQLLTGLAEAFA